MDQGERRVIDGEGTNAELIYWKQVHFPIQLYKASENRFLEGMMKQGEFQITQLDDFIEMDRHGLEIGDRMEGRYNLHVTDTVISTEGKVGEILPGLTVSPGYGEWNVKIVNSDFGRKVAEPLFIFSMASYPSLLMIDTINKARAAETPPKPPYDGYAEIHEPLNFAANLTVALRKRLACPVAFQLHPCIYCKRETEYPDTSGDGVYLPLAKSPGFSYQLEWRILFHPKEMPKDRSIVLQSDDCATYVKRIIPYADLK